MGLSLDGEGLLGEGLVVLTMMKPSVSGESLTSCVMEAAIVILHLRRYTVADNNFLQKKKPVNVLYMYWLLVNRIIG